MEMTLAKPAWVLSEGVVLDDPSPAAALLFDVSDHLLIRETDFFFSDDSW